MIDGGHRCATLREFYPEEMEGTWDCYLIKVIFYFPFHWRNSNPFSFRWRASNPFSFRWRASNPWWCQQKVKIIF